MDTHDIIVIGGSTGALAPLKQVFARFPADLPAAVFVVRHIAPDGGDMLTDILGMAGPIKVKTAADGDLIENGKAYIAPAGRHLLVDHGLIQLGRGPRENMARPAIDPLFRSAAINYGPRVIGVLLSGVLDDGASGLSAVRRCGGITVVQDPGEAVAGDMPLNALAANDIDYRFPAAKMGEALAQITTQPALPALVAPSDLVLEVQIAAGRPSTTDVLMQIARPVALSCPACSGVLSQIAEPSRLRFRCQIGHAYTADALDQEQQRSVVEAIGVAIRILEERHTLLVKMAEHARHRGHDQSVNQFDERAQEYRQQADKLRKAIFDDVP